MINMVMKIKQAEVYWHLTDQCTMGCEYCPPRYRAGNNNKTVHDYLRVVEKLQTSRYKNAESILWKISGGEPIHFPGFNQLVKKMKTQPCYIRLDTSGGNSWFDLLETKDYIDHYKLTHHHWQNESVLNFIVDFCAEHEKRLSVVVPLYPGRIFEDREKIAMLKSQGLDVYEQILYNDNRKGDYWSGYSKIDINRINNRADDWEEPQGTGDPTEPVYVDLAKPPDDGSPSYTGLGCYAGVDYIYISHKGFAAGSNCGGRDIGNVFHADWAAPDSAFPCCVNYCRSEVDRKKLRVGLKPD